MKKKIFVASLLLLTFTCSISGQLAMGKWRTHFAYNSVSQVAISENKIFAISDGALFSVEKADNGQEFYSKLSGLSGTNILNIEFDKINNQLFIIYSNGNIDVLGTNGITNIPDLFNKQMTATKDVNNIQFYNNKAYLACNFGILVLDSKKKEVADTYIIGQNATDIKVLNTCIHKGIIYALSTNTIYKASISNPNLVNYEFWSTLNSLPGSGELQKILSFSNNLFVLRGGVIYKQEIDNTWTTFHSELTASNMIVSNENLIIFSTPNTYIFDSNFNSTKVNYNNPINNGQLDIANGTFWFAGNQKGLISYNTTNAEVKEYNPNGPATNVPYAMTFSKQKLVVLQGGRWGAQYGRSGDVMIYENNTWTNIYGSSIRAITNKPVLDFMNVAFDPMDDKHFFVTSFGTGLFEFKDNAFLKWHNHTNSTIQGHPAVPGDPWNYSRIDGPVFDDKGNLFFNNSAVAASVKVLLANGEWKELTYPNASKDTYGKIIINNQNKNQKWSISVRGGEILVFDDNGTIEDQKDDKSIILTSFPDSDNEGSYISPGSNYSIAQDKKGAIWLGTEAGPLVFNNTSTVFNPGFRCTKIKIPRNDGTGSADYLLANEIIKAIAIDGANRKWIGTATSGVYLMSENGQETIQHFTSTNSPLLSNDILSIAINQVTGEVFFGTGLGLISYQGDAADASTKFENVYAYPNPVRENYNGIITITGLVENTQVKITDIRGNLICQTISNGSLATWDGKDVHGKKVSTGIYLAICVNSDGTESTITKIMVIN